MRPRNLTICAVGVVWTLEEWVFIFGIFSLPSVHLSENQSSSNLFPPLLLRVLKTEERLTERTQTRERLVVLSHGFVGFRGISSVLSWFCYSVPFQSLSSFLGQILFSFEFSLKYLSHYFGSTWLCPQADFHLFFSGSDQLGFWW